MRFDAGRTVSQREVHDRLAARQEGERLQQDSLVKAFMSERFDRASCLAAMSRPDPDDPDRTVIVGGTTAHSNRYSTCRVVSATASLTNVPGVVGHMWVVMVNNTDPFTRTVTSNLWIADAEVAGGTLADREKVRSIDFSFSLECVGIEGSTCDDKGAGDPMTPKFFEGAPQDFRYWEMRDQATEPMTLSYQTASSPASKTTPFLLQQFPEAGAQQDSDNVSYHQMSITMDGEGDIDDYTADDQFRCDNAAYVRARHGCVWKRLQADRDPGRGRLDTHATYVVPHGFAPSWADHVLGAQQKPLQTQPYAPDPNRPGAPANPFGWASPFNIGGGTGAPSNGLFLNRIYIGVHNERSQQGQHAGTQVNLNRNTVGRACNHVNQSPPGMDRPECDEYPFASTWEGAQYTVDRATAPKPWKFSVRMIPRSDNGKAGRDLRLFYSWGHILHGGDAFHVKIVDVPATREAHEASHRAYEKRLAAKERSRPETGMKAPRAGWTGDDVCTMPDLPGIEYVCDFDADMVKYDNGTLEAFTVRKDGQGFHNVTKDGRWTGWQAFGGWHTGPIEVVKQTGGAVTLRTTGTDGNLYYKERNAATGTWNEWHQ
ncbi:hypothetical protein AB0H82_14055 [Streptomyces sp. NPDC050732]|uniref:NucA/NucB deoxyribonuclease domain-containing protein n=1 Tax=Streptomyces sp. NPDC050732 TaxID=3154632 RepID=UPI003431AE58